MDHFIPIPDDCLNIIYSFLPSKYKIIMKHNYLVHKIISYLPFQSQILISKYYYNMHKHKIVIKKDKMGMFLTSIVKKNLDKALLEYMQKIDTNIWFDHYKCYYGKYMFLNIMSRMEHLCIQYNAYKCRLIIQDLINKHKHKNKNKHKNKIYKNIIWK